MLTELDGTCVECGAEFTCGQDSCVCPVCGHEDTESGYWGDEDEED